MRVNRGSREGGGSDRGEGREGADALESRTDRGNQNDEDLGSSASRGGGGGEINVPRSGSPGDPDPMPESGARFGEGPITSSNPDVTGTTDALED